MLSGVDQSQPNWGGHDAEDDIPYARVGNARRRLSKKPKWLPLSQFNRATDRVINKHEQSPWTLSVNQKMSHRYAGVPMPKEDSDEEEILDEDMNVLSRNPSSNLDTVAGLARKFDPNFKSQCCSLRDEPSLMPYHDDTDDLTKGPNAPSSSMGKVSSTISDGTVRHGQMAYESSQKYLDVLRDDIRCKNKQVKQSPATYQGDSTEVIQNLTVEGYGPRSIQHGIVPVGNQAFTEIALLHSKFRDGTCGGVVEMSANLDCAGPSERDSHRVAAVMATVNENSAHSGSMEGGHKKDCHVQEDNLFLDNSVVKQNLGKQPHTMLGSQSTSTETSAKELLFERSRRYKSTNNKPVMTRNIHGMGFSAHRFWLT